MRQGSFGLRGGLRCATHSLHRLHHAESLWGFSSFLVAVLPEVIRSLAHVLPQQAWDITIVSSSLQVSGLPGDAHTFFAGLDLHPLDCTSCAGRCRRRATPPLPPSYEDRPGAPDRVFAAVDDATFAHLTDVWAQALQEAGAAKATILHLHHLTPLNAAAARVAPHVPVIGHLHGTELLMLERIAQGPPADWVHANTWADRMRTWAAACQVLIVPSASLVARALALLGIPLNAVSTCPTGLTPSSSTGAPWTESPSGMTSSSHTLRVGVLVISQARWLIQLTKYRSLRPLRYCSMWDGSQPSNA